MSAKPSARWRKSHAKEPGKEAGQRGGRPEAEHPCRPGTSWARPTWTRRVAENLREHRKRRDMSLDQLAQPPA